MRAGSRLAGWCQPLPMCRPSCSWTLQACQMHTQPFVPCLCREEEERRRQLEEERRQREEQERLER